MLSLHLTLLGIYSVLFGLTISSYMWFHRTFDRYDSPLIVVMIALFLQLNGILMTTLHLWWYSSNGHGIPVFDIFGLISHMMSEITYSSLFMMLAYGWTISFQDIDWDNNLEIYLPVGSIVVAVHLVLAAMTYIDVDAYHKYHDFAGI